MAANVDEAGGFFTDARYGRENHADYEDLISRCATDCKCSRTLVRARFKRIRHNRSRTSWRLAEVMSAADARRLALSIQGCKNVSEATFYDGAEDFVRFVYLKHPLGDASKEAAKHLLDDPAVQQAIGVCKKVMLDMSSKKRRRGDTLRLKRLAPRQVFANMYPPGGLHAAPWHRDVDTTLGSAIVVLQGDGEDYVHLSSGSKGVQKLAPEPGSAIVMSKNCEHAVPARTSRKHTRVALVIWI